jgi:hypothetical protein
MPSRLILARYFAREILQTTLAVTLILLLIFLSGRFARYLADAATGKISADIILTLLLISNAPNILERILPLGFISRHIAGVWPYVCGKRNHRIASGWRERATIIMRASWACDCAGCDCYRFANVVRISPAGFQHVERMLNHEKATQ